MRTELPKKPETVQLREFSMGCAPIAMILALFLSLTLWGCNSPNVDPDVDPKGKSDLVVVVLDDMTNRTPETGKILHDDQFWQKIQAQGHEFKSVDVANPASGPFKADAGNTLPAILLYKSSSMKLLKVAKLPEDTAAIDDLIRKFGGKRERGPPIYRSMSGKLVSEPDIYVEPDTGHVRRLGMIPADAKARARRQQMMGLGEFLKKKGATLIPSEKWVDVDPQKYLQPQWVLDQHDSSGCVGWSEAGAHMQCRDRRGMKFEILSGGFTYAHINGGRDGGAMILDAMLAGKKYGHALKSEFDYPNLFYRQIPQSVRDSSLLRQTIAAYPVDTIEEVATALQLGFVVQAGVQVDGNFSSFDSNGISRARGRYANHSIYLDGMKKIDGKTVYRLRNSWGMWGPFKNGSCWIRPEGIIIEGDAFVHADSEWLPSDLPTPKKAIQPPPAPAPGPVVARPANAPATVTLPYVVPTAPTPPTT